MSNNIPTPYEILQKDTVVDMLIIPDIIKKILNRSRSRCMYDMSFMFTVMSTIGEDRPISDNGWYSIDYLESVVSRLMEKGYKCETKKYMENTKYLIVSLT
uniref:Uncharacterized protein n=1 Tax=viral metagenome TaxID=1070528 RepID=A0A6C0CJQ1_9ZZZZ